jgi:hypothetical protein
MADMRIAALRIGPGVPRHGFVSLVAATHARAGLIALTNDRLVTLVPCETGGLPNGITADTPDGFTEGANELFGPYTSPTSFYIQEGGGGTWEVYVTLTAVPPPAADPYGGFELTAYNSPLDLPIPTAATPLPSTWTMLIAGFVGLGFFAYRGTKKNPTALVAA